MSTFVVLGTIIFLIVLLCYYVKKQTNVKAELKKAESNAEVKEKYAEIDDIYDTMSLDVARDRMREKLHSVSTFPTSTK